MKAAGALLVLLLCLCEAGAWWDGNVFDAEMKKLEESLKQPGENLKRVEDLVSGLLLQLKGTVWQNKTQVRMVKRQIEKG